VCQLSGNVELIFFEFPAAVMARDLNDLYADSETLANPGMKTLEGEEVNQRIKV